MTTIGIAMVRDEADIIEPVLRHMAEQVDHLIVADNLSRDETVDILWDLAGHLPLTVINDADPRYVQSEKMTRLAQTAMKMGADWVVPFDADEWWYSPFGRIADVLATEDSGSSVLAAAIYNHYATALDPIAENPIERMGWREVNSLSMHKVACRARDDLVIEQGNHGARYGILPYVRPGLLVIRHFPYRSVAQLVRKVRNGAEAYRAAGDSLPSDMGAHWRQWGQALETDGEAWIEELFTTWYYREEPTAEKVIGDDVLPPLIYDPAP